MSLVLVAVLAQAGETSVSRVPSVETGPLGLLRVGVDGAVGASATFPEPGVNHRRTQTSVRFGYSPVDGWELFGSVGGSTLTGPRQLSAQGDARLGLKWKPSGPGAWWALDAVFLLPSGLDGGFPVTSATGLTLRALAGHAVGSGAGLDLRVDAVLGVAMDRTRNVLGDLTATPTQLYGLDVQRGGSVVGGVALSGSSGPWMPFVELSSAVPTYAATPDAPRLLATRATAGVRWAFARGASLDAALDLAVGRTAANDLFRTAPPWEGRAGVSIALDPLKSLGEPLPAPPPEIRTVYVEKAAPAPKIIEVPAPARDGVLAGRVFGPDGRGIADVVLEASTGRTITDADGRFELRLPAGRVGLAVKHPAFEPVTLTRDLTAGARTPVDLRLVPRPPVGSILAHVTRPAGSVMVKATGASVVTVTLEDGQDLALDALAPGSWRLVFSGPAVLARARTVEVVARRAVPLEVSLSGRPPVSALDLATGLATRTPLPFDGDAPAVAAAAVLDELADVALAQRTDVSLEVVGVLPAGLKGAKAEVAAARRAEAVKAALVERGVPAERLKTGLAPPPKKARPAPTVLFELVP